MPPIRQFDDNTPIHPPKTLQIKLLKKEKNCENVEISAMIFENAPLKNFASGMRSIMNWSE